MLCTYVVAVVVADVGGCARSFCAGPSGRQGDGDRAFGDGRRARARTDRSTETFVRLRVDIQIKGEVERARERERERDGVSGRLGGGEKSSSRTGLSVLSAPATQRRSTELSRRRRCGT